MFSKLSYLHDDWKLFRELASTRWRRYDREMKICPDYHLITKLNKRNDVSIRLRSMCPTLLIQQIVDFSLAKQDPRGILFGGIFEILLAQI